MSRCIAIVGGTHRGKSTFIKGRIKGREHLILDIKREYKRGFKRYPNANREEFFTYIDEKPVKNTIIVLEEASFYLSHRHYSTKCEKLIVNKWESLNTYFVVYHSIRKIPDWMYDYLDAMVLFKTNDRSYKIKNHPEEVVEAFQLVNKKSTNNKHYHTYIQLDDI